jgi:RNA polymerase sigma-54 factor
MIKPGLQLGLGQQLTVTPQLRQALKLLQYSALELQANVSNVLERNVMLEQTEPDEARPESADDAADGVDDAGADLDVPDFDARETPGRRASSADPDSWRDRTQAAEETLADYLVWQLGLARLNDRDYAIGAALIDSIDDNGYLRAGVEDIGQLAGLSADRGEVEAVLHRIQTFDPPGVGARTLAECLALQLGGLADDTPGKAVAARILTNYLDVLAAGDERAIRVALDIDQPSLAEARALIKTLDPHPGGALGATAADYVIPDVLVTREARGWRCVTNPAVAPTLRVNPLYERCLRDYRGATDQAPLRRQLEEARWLLRSLKMRADTLYKVASAIVAFQQDFFDFGEEAMKPLALKGIAEPLGMHESTISRVCANKTMATPRGLLEFRYFFSNAVSHGAASDHSATAIRARIRKLIGAENAARPLSDSRISTVLKAQGVDVARRTVAKYRESLAIPPSHQRKNA